MSVHNTQRTLKKWGLDANFEIPLKVSTTPWVPQQCSSPKKRADHCVIHFFNERCPGRHRVINPASGGTETSVSFFHFPPRKVDVSSKGKFWNGCLDERVILSPKVSVWCVSKLWRQRPLFRCGKSMIGSRIRAQLVVILFWLDNLPHKLNERRSFGAQSCCRSHVRETVARTRGEQRGGASPRWSTAGLQTDCCRWRSSPVWGSQG